MSFVERKQSITIQADADLSTKQFFLVKLSADGQAALAGNGEAAIGVLQNKPAAVGRDAEVAIEGVFKVVAGSTIAIGDDIASDAAGEAVPAATGDQILGIAMEAAANGEIFAVLWQPRGTA